MNLFDIINTILPKINTRFDNLEKEKLKDDIREMKRSYNYHIHKDNYSFVFNADRMEDHANDG